MYLGSPQISKVKKNIYIHICTVYCNYNYNFRNIRHFTDTDDNTSQKRIYYSRIVENFLSNFEEKMNAQMKLVTNKMEKIQDHKFEHWKRDFIGRTDKEIETVSTMVETMKTIMRQNT